LTERLSKPSGLSEETGIPREIRQLWSDYLKPRGYRILCQIIDFPGGMPGDISIVLSWGDD
jgi:hypothetical protein